MTQDEFNELQGDVARVSQQDAALGKVLATIVSHLAPALASASPASSEPAPEAPTVPSEPASDAKGEI